MLGPERAAAGSPAPVAEPEETQAGQEVEGDQHGEDQGVDHRGERVELGLDAVA